MSSKQTKGLNRNTIDKYYTKNTIVDTCLNLFKNNIQINTNDLIIEPSAGNGAFIAGIKGLGCKFKFYDISPEHDEIVEQDYLLYDYTEDNKIHNKTSDKIHNKTSDKTHNKIHIIGNPPFGRQSSLAIKFIKKSCEFCDSISFILPKSFKKDSLKKAFPLNFHLVCEIDLPEKSFLVDNIEYHVPCIFQIWEKRENNRILIEKLQPVGFIFVEKTKNPDISFRRVGVNAGEISSEVAKKSVQSHFFIKFTNGKSTIENINKLSTIIYEFNNTVGPKSISKQELVSKFNPLLAI